MSFPSGFGSQVAAIMEVLSKAAVAEITKLVEDGSVVLRLEMRRRDAEIQELRRSLKMIEAELCKTKEAASTRVTVDKQIQTTTWKQVQPEETEDIKTSGVYEEPFYELSNVLPTVKDEPPDEVSTMETQQQNDNNNTAADVCIKAEEHDDSVWPSPAVCSMMEKNMAAHTADGSSFNSVSTQEVTNVCLNQMPIKMEVGILPVCVQSSESHHNEEFRHSGVSQDQFQPGPSLAQKPTTTEHHHLNNRNNIKAKRPMNVWRTNQRLLICSVCNKGFPRLSQLEDHINKTHQPVTKPFRCLECGKSFTQKTRLKTHQSVHTGERPYSCKICGKMFSRHDNCLRHERFHSGKRPFSCRQCGQSFTAQGNLKIHQRIHLQER